MAEEKDQVEASLDRAIAMLNELKTGSKQSAIDPTGTTFQSGPVDLSQEDVDALLNEAEAMIGDIRERLPRQSDTTSESGNA